VRPTDALLSLAAQPVLQSGANLKNVKPGSVTPNLHAVVTSPKEFNSVWCIPWAAVGLATRKQWEKDLPHFALQGYPHPEALLEEPSKTNLDHDIANKIIPNHIYGKDRKVKGYYPSVAASGSAQHIYLPHATLRLSTHAHLQ
jgi:hypothetical protein